MMKVNVSLCNSTLLHLGVSTVENTVLIISSIVIFWIALCAVIGNVIILSAIIYKKRRMDQNNFETAFTLVGSLAIADILVGFVAMPFYTYLLWRRDTRATDFICLFGFAFDVLVCTSSIFHIIMMAADRYLAICKPLYHRTQPHWISFVYVAIAWIVPTLISVPPIFSHQHLTDDEKETNCAVCLSNFQSVDFRIISNIISFYIPAIIICILYFKLYYTIKKRFSIRENVVFEVNETHSSEHIAHAEKAAAKTIGLILSCFLLSWTPFFVLNLCFLVMDNELMHLILLILQILSYGNSMMNPIVYYRCNKSIKESVHEMFKYFRCREWIKVKEKHMTNDGFDNAQTRTNLSNVDKAI